MCNAPSTFANTGKEVIYGPGGLPSNVLLTVQCVAAVALVVSLVVVYHHLRRPEALEWQAAFRVAWIFWVFAPPIWFSAEYFWLYKQCGQAGTFEAFKYGQELAYRTWLGIATAMTILFVQKT